MTVPVLPGQRHPIAGNLQCTPEFYRAIDQLVQHVRALGDGGDGGDFASLSDQVTRLGVQLAGLTTDQVKEGSRLYFTDARVYAAAKAILQAGSNVTITADDGAKTLTIAATGGGTVTGVLLQAVEVSTANVASTTSTGIPLDNTIPQKTEGDHLTDYDITITPTSAGSKLVVSLDLSWVGVSSAGTGVRLAAFRDGGSDAVFATSVSIQSNSPVRIEFSVDASSTASTTFSFRWGVSGNTAYIHRTSATSAAFGGVMKSRATIRELAA